MTENNNLMEELAPYMCKCTNPQKKTAIELCLAKGVPDNVYGPIYNMIACAEYGLFSAKSLINRIYHLLETRGCYRQMSEMERKPEEQTQFPRVSQKPQVTQTYRSPPPYPRRQTSLPSQFPQPSTSQQFSQNSQNQQTSFFLMTSTNVRRIHRAAQTILDTLYPVARSINQREADEIYSSFVMGCISPIVCICKMHVITVRAHPRAGSASYVNLIETS